MFRLLVTAAAILCVGSPAFSQTTPIIIVNGTYFEDFNSMGTGSPTYASGWNSYKVTGTGSNLAAGAFIATSTDPAFTTSNGSSGMGTVYNYGATGNSDCALGSVASTTTAAGFGVVLVNNTGRILTSADVEISFRSEQWRGASTAENEVWEFQWNVGDATLDVNNTTLAFNTSTALNINEILTSSTSAGAVDGNVNFVNIGPGTLVGLTWSPGERLVLRWLDIENPLADAGMAIDNFSFTVFAPVPEPATLMLCGFGLVGWALVRRLKKAC